MMESHGFSKAHQKILSLVGLYVYTIQHFFLLSPTLQKSRTRCSPDIDAAHWLDSSGIEFACMENQMLWL
jgi:hypothetical protein